MPGNVTIQGNVSGLPAGADLYQPVYNILTPILAITPFTIVAGANTINVPTGANLVIWTPDVTYTGTLSWGGIPMHPTQSGYWPFPVGGAPATIVVTASANMTNPMIFRFY